MPTSIQISPVRRVAVGVSATAQGADGVGELTRTAYAALLAAEWTNSPAAPSIPVHDYAQALPTGDAWKACYGYDAAARTERAACGAVCYSYAIPADALTGDLCNIVSVSALVTGDRYLDAGVDCHVVLSASAAPPSVAELAARTPDATLCATSSQTEPPNKRVGVTAPLAVAPGAAATAFVHVALLLHDYEGHRGAWIEGGAMLAVDPASGGGASSSPTISVTFSRDVSAGSVVATRALDMGGVDTSTSTWMENRRNSVPAPKWEGMVWICPWNAASGVPTSDALQPSYEARALLDACDAVFPTNVTGGLIIYISRRSDYPRYRVSLASQADGATAQTIAPQILSIVRSTFADGAFNEIQIPISASSSNDNQLLGGPVEYAIYQPTVALSSMQAGPELCTAAFWRGESTQVRTVIDWIAPGEVDDHVIWEVPGSSGTSPSEMTPIPVECIGVGNLPAGVPCVLPFPRRNFSGLVTLLVAIRPDRMRSSIDEWTQIDSDATVSLQLRD